MNCMSKIVSIGCGCALGVASVVALAQPATGTKPAQPTKAPEKAPATPAKPATPAQPATPAKPATPAAPAAQPTEAEMMAMMAELGKPGKMHEFLTANAGTWDGKCTSWNPMDPAAAPTTSTCVTVTKSVMGGLYTTSETKGSFEMAPGTPPFPFEGFGLNTYNTGTKKFECTWADNMAPMILTFTGDLIENGKTLSMTANFHCPMRNGPCWMRLIEKHTSSTTMTLEMWGPTMDNKGEFKMMQIDYTKKN